MQLLGRGQYSDALSHFHAAVDADPNNYMSYYKRATVFLALGRSRPALADLDKVLAKDHKHEEATRLYTSVEPLQQTLREVEDLMMYKNYQPAIDRLTEIVEQIPWNPHLRELRADAYLGVGNTIHAIS